MIGNRQTTPLRKILENCLAHIDKLEATKTVSDQYEKEFQDLKNFSENLKSQREFACTEGEKEVNRKKNRYKDILPFNVSRVVLAEICGVVGSNYVNANYIKGASGSPAYIASQGPLPNTVNDFWRMVVECEVQVIIMACNAEEAGKHKCESYWVEREDEERKYGMVEIKLVKANAICPDFLVRTMRLKYTNEKGVIEERTVCQFHYSAWPDHGVPPLVRPLLDMVRLVRDTQASETLPVLVHCSAGCGRTGTICAIDFVWGLLRLGKLSTEFSLFNLVRDMRKQRVAMVQTKEQYILVHQAVRELFKEQLEIIDSHHYENISAKGEPILLNANEPIYQTLILPSLYTEEKQDRNKLEREITTSDFCRKHAPPLPKKKNVNVLSSKQEKEVENLTQKNRIAVSLKAMANPESSPDNTLIRKPKIAKLKALFERGSSNSGRSSPKSKNSSISRSHSLGPVRKPALAELIKTPETTKVSTNEPAIRSGGKLRVPKLLSPAPRTVPSIKRSKSLKISKDNTPLLTLLQYVSNEDLIGDEKRPIDTSERYENDSKTLNSQREAYDSRRRRSLESLIGEEPPEITWHRAVAGPKRPVMFYQDRRLHESRRNIPDESRIVPTENPNSIGSSSMSQRVRDQATSKSLSFRHQFNLLSHASQKTINSLASGLGIRERRNSFRQAVSKQDYLEGRFVSVPDGSGSSVYVDGSLKPQKETLTVRAQNGEILKPENVRRNPGIDGKDRISSQSMRLPSKNRFLYRLKNELESNGQSGGSAKTSTTDIKQRKPEIQESRPEMNVHHKNMVYVTNFGPNFVRVTSSASSQSSDNLSDYARRPEKSRERPRTTERQKTDLSSESSSSSGAKELNTVLKLKNYQHQVQRDTSWPVVSRSKSTSYALEALSRPQPVAPPRVRRNSGRGSTVSRHNSVELVQHKIHKNTSESKDWRGALGVDLDAVAASMHRQNEPTYSVLRATLPGSDPSSPTSPPSVNIRKQQYL